MVDAEPSEACPPRQTLTALFLRFLRFGVLAFGGPVAQIAMIRRELVDEERWIDSSRFNRLLAVMQVLPGPEAHELCVHMGIRARGRLGGLLAGLGFMLPGLVLMLLAAWAYSELAGRSPTLAAVFVGVQATVLAIIARAVHRIGEHILTSLSLWIIMGATAVATVAGLSFWIVLPAAGLSYAGVRSGRWWLVALALFAAIALGLITQSDAAEFASPPSAAMAATTFALFLAGLKGGLLTFGGAYTAIPFVRADTVDRGWATDAQFLDGVGLANVLPAPLVIFATFVGWMSGGLTGALVITAGMFLPAFAFSMIFYERLERVVENERLQTFLAGVAAAVVGVIAVTTFELAKAAVANTPNLLLTASLFLVGLVVVYFWKSRYSAPLVLVTGAIIGAALPR
ncbi:chromate efflux transporter [Brevundimonas sp. NPDC058933]|uniref:chromate efflux transporter n=1 Tax=Brevundimonas sp. NPDC058933 TaxID=3346673 RepID=UPI003BEF22F0